MSTSILSLPILATKLYIPPPRPKVVARLRLIELLEEGAQRKLTLISAPAGFGKTTLVSEWIAASTAPAARQVAWLSLDEGDRDPNRFLTYLIAALQTISPHLGAGVLALLQDAQPPPLPVLLTALLNEIAPLAYNVVLVLDDYHTVDSPAVDEVVAFLLEHLPPQMHLLMTTREDPPLPLARLRARGHMTEVRAAALRFTPDEAADFLLEVMGLQLSAAQVATLEARTEGWIAGLQLAALSMRGREDIAHFVQAFAGDNRYIVDYLVEEVLQRQPEQVRSFLFQTAILDHLSGPLCNAVTGRSDGQVLLESLERSNFFVVPLDDQRHWYRYHHLFAGVLLAHLRAEQPEQRATLHRRASAWYARHDLPADAIRHALAAEDFGRAASLVERAAPTLRRNRQEATLLGWLKALPDELVRVRPVLSVEYAGALLSSGEVESAEAHLRDAEQWLARSGQSQTSTSLHPPASNEETVSNIEEFRRLPGVIAVYRAGLALARGDIAQTVTYARRALELLARPEHLWRGAAAALLGLAHWTTGDLEAAYHSYAEGMANLQRAGHISDVIGGAIALVDIRITQGRLRQAMRIYEQALQLAAQQDTALLRGTADMYVGMSQLYREQNELEAATQLLHKSQALGEAAGFPQNRYRARVAMARIHEAQGDLDSALDLLQEAEAFYVSDLYPNVRPVAAQKVRIWLAQGRLGDALAWAEGQGLSAQGNLGYLREFEQITFARILLARHQSHPATPSLREAIGLLERLLPAAQAGGRMGSALENLVLQALAYQMQEEIPAALMALQQALTLAEPEGYVRIFVDEGLPMAHLLRQAAKAGIRPAYIAKLLAPLEGDEPPDTAAPIYPLIEPLSSRELDVLRLFKSELSGPEIARELVIALSTLRTHTKAIYGKLNVNSRRAAVNRAIELKLI